jgi:hypothetical protein
VIGGGTLQAATEGPHRHYAAMAGYEVALPFWLIHRVEVNTYFRDRTVIAPSTEAATPFLLVIPSLSAGLGIPISIRPHADIGVRFQMSIQYPFLGFVAFADMNASTPNVHGSLMRGSL